MLLNITCQFLSYFIEFVRVDNQESNWTNTLYHERGKTSGSIINDVIKSKNPYSIFFKIMACSL